MKTFVLLACLAQWTAAGICPMTIQAYAMPSPMTGHEGHIRHEAPPTAMDCAGSQCLMLTPLENQAPASEAPAATNAPLPVKTSLEQSVLASATADTFLRDARPPGSAPFLLASVVLRI